MTNKEFIESFFHDAIHADKHGSLKYSKDVNKKYSVLWHYGVVICLVDHKKWAWYINPRRYTQTTSKMVTLVTLSAPWDIDRMNVSFDEFKKMCEDNNTPVES